MLFVEPDSSTVLKTKICTIYREDRHDPVVVGSQLPDNENTSVTNMAEYLAAAVMEGQDLPTVLTWVEHYPRA